MRNDRRRKNASGVIIARRSGKVRVAVERTIVVLTMMIGGLRTKKGTRNETGSASAIEVIGMDIETGIGTATIATMTKIGIRIGRESKTENNQIGTKTMIGLVGGADEVPVASATHHPDRHRPKLLQHRGRRAPKERRRESSLRKINRI